MSDFPRMGSFDRITAARAFARENKNRWPALHGRRVILRVEVVAAMNSRSDISYVVPCQMHRRSATRLAEQQALRRELARLDNIKDHVLDVVADRLLDVLDLPAQEAPAPELCEPVLVRINPDCVEQTVGRTRVPV